MIVIARTNNPLDNLSVIIDETEKQINLLKKDLDYFQQSTERMNFNQQDAYDWGCFRYEELQQAITELRHELKQLKESRNND